MYKRLFTPPKNSSFFLFGPRGVGKTHFIRSFYKKALFFDLLQSSLYQSFLASPERLSQQIPSDYTGWVVIDEVQKVPALLDEVHRLIETRKLLFVLTGSSARKLKREQTNLLAGRALRCLMYPLSVEELKDDFDLKTSLELGHIPKVFSSENPKAFLKSYIEVYLKEEIQQEGLTRSLPAFSRFLESASFAQGSPLVMTNIARDCHVSAKVVENYFSILRDTLLSYELPIFSKRAKRALMNKRKFYFFDVGVFRAIRPQGVLDSSSYLNGIALETLVLQEISAHNEIHQLGYEIFYWRTRKHLEVDFILYGEKGFKAIEVKCRERINQKDFKGLLEFKKDYPESDLLFLYTGPKDYSYQDIQILNVERFLKNLSTWVC